MKVVFYSTSGEDLYRFRLPVAQPLAAAGYSIVFVGPPGEAANRIDQAGFAYRAVPISTEGVEPLYDLASGVRLARTYREIDPDITHHFGLAGVVQGAVAAKMISLNWVVQSIPPLGNAQESRTMSRTGVSGFLRWALRGSEVTFRSPEDRQTLIAKGCVRPEQTHIIRSSGVDLNVYAFRDEPARTPVVAMIGSLEDPSEIDLFVEASRRIHRTGQAARMVLLGTGPGSEAAERNRIRLQTAQEEGIIEWWGFRDQIADSLGKVHLVYLPDCSGEEAERILLASAATGRPAVAARTPGCSHFIQEEASGMLVEPGNVEALATALRDLIEHPDRRRSMGRRARDLAETEYSADLVARATMSVYERLFERGRPI